MTKIGDVSNSSLLYGPILNTKQECPQNLILIYKKLNREFNI